MSKRWNQDTGVLNARLRNEPLNRSAVHTGRPGLQPLLPEATKTLGHSTGGCGELLAISFNGVGGAMKGLVVERKGFSFPLGLTGETGETGREGSCSLL
ncbi:hypothetical protein E2C01_033669 [Portunus trituberculatus]|uniref:Uncharacterized protein n=1 Tax=Portunus trituberculatus TaxID=210409 RepID=A0A5B7F3A1_PORTR|nr:hypothetical protein [Portunus trituberculatus]